MLEKAGIWYEASELRFERVLIVSFKLQAVVGYLLVLMEGRTHSHSAAKAGYACTSCT